MTLAAQQSLNGIKYISQKLDLVATNIANADVENNSKIKAIQQSSFLPGQAHGDLSYIKYIANIDEQFAQTVMNNMSELEYADIQKNYLEDVVSEFGKPGQYQSIDSYIANVFKEIDSLQLNPDSVSQKFLVTKTLNSLSERMSKMALNIENMRFTIDRTISSKILDVNNLLNTTFENSKKMSALMPDSQEYISMKINVLNNIQDLSKYFKLSPYKISPSGLSLYAVNGLNLVDTDSKYQVRYTGAEAVSSFINDVSLNSIYVAKIDPVTGEDMPSNSRITDSLPSSQTKNTLKSGMLAGLLDMRDSVLPRVLESLDVIAKKISDLFNLIHNNGNAFPITGSLTSSSMFARNEDMNFSGSIRLAALDPLGSRVPNLMPLTLNLSELDTGSGVGKANMEGILDEINYHFGEKQYKDNRLQFGNFRDVKLISKSTDFSPPNSINFGLEVENFSGTDSDIAITNVSITDALSNVVPSTYSNSAIITPTGKTTKSGNISIAPQSLNYPVNITVTYQTMVNGVPKLASAVYTINVPAPNPFNGMINQRFSASLASGDASIVAPLFQAPILTAALINKTGGEINISSQELGRVRISSFDSTKFGFAIDQMDSAYQGNPAVNKMPTSATFSQTLGLNDLFTRSDSMDNVGKLKNSALYMALRDDIVSSPYSLAVASLTPVTPDVYGEDKYTYELTSGSNANVVSLSKLKNTPVFFGNTANLSQQSVTLETYAQEVLSYFATISNFAKHDHENQSLLTESALSKFQSQKGIDPNEEMSNMLRLQFLYSANAKVLTNQKERFQILIDAF